MDGQHARIGLWTVAPPDGHGSVSADARGDLDCHDQRNRRRDYDLLAEDDSGQLTVQGTRYKGFDRQRFAG